MRPASLTACLAAVPVAREAALLALTGRAAWRAAAGGGTGDLSENFDAFTGATVYANPTVVTAGFLTFSTNGDFGGDPSWRLGDTATAGTQPVNGTGFVTLVDLQGTNGSTTIDVAPLSAIGFDYRGPTNTPSNDANPLSLVTSLDDTATGPTILGISGGLIGIVHTDGETITSLQVQDLTDDRTFFSADNFEACSADGMPAVPLPAALPLALAGQGGSRQAARRGLRAPPRTWRFATAGARQGAVLPARGAPMLDFALAVFLLIATPGPGVLSAAGVGSAFGRGPGLAYIAGLWAGNNLVAWLVISGLAAAALAVPWLRVVLLWGSAAYLLYLAAKIAFAGARIAFLEPDRAPGFWNGLALQPINPKAYAVNTSFFSGFAFMPGAPGTEIALKLLIMNAIWIPIHLGWLWAGLTLRRLELAPGTTRAINAGMALAMLVVVGLALSSAV